MCQEAASYRKTLIQSNAKKATVNRFICLTTKKDLQFVGLSTYLLVLSTSTLRSTYHKRTRRMHKWGRKAIYLSLSLSLNRTKSVSPRSPYTENKRLQQLFYHQGKAHRTSFFKLNLKSFEGSRKTLAY